MEYAIISFRKNQYYVKAGQKIMTLGEAGKVGDVLTDVETLMVKDGEVKIGTPTVEFPISLKVVEISKTDKVDIFKYKAKSKYRRHTGHRQAMTMLEIVLGESKKAKAPAKPAVKADKAGIGTKSKTKAVKPAKTAITTA